MFSWLKNRFIPNTGNNHRPYILRKSNIRTLVIVILFIEIFTFIAPTLNYISRTGGMASVISAVLNNLTNNERQSQNLQTLKTNPLLVKAAEMKAEDMAKNEYFAHTSPTGKTPWYWIDQVGYKYQYAGENLAINFTDSKDVTNAWMNSPTHKANIVKDKYTEVGTGIAKGIYNGRETIFVAQIYANPSEYQTILPATPAKTDTAKNTNKIINTVESKNVLGAETISTTKDIKLNLITKEFKSPTFLQKTFASPHNTINILLYGFLGLVVMALILNVIIKIKNHHPDLVTNGLILITIIVSIFLTNNFLSYKDMKTIQGIDYSIENK